MLRFCTRRLLFSSSSALLAVPPSSSSSTSNAKLPLATTSVAKPSGLLGPLSRRMHGTVTAFKHRRGYGFVLAEGYTTSAAADMVTPTNGLGAVGETYFFTRTALNEGFYITEGERVAFNVVETNPKTVADKSSAVPAADEVTGDASGRTPRKVRQKAIHICVYDPKTGAESPVRPIMLSGKVVQFDPIEGRGVIAELDVEGHYHDDAPRYVFLLENLSLAPSSTMTVGRYVLFSILEDGAGRNYTTHGLPVADRIIFHPLLERTRTAADKTPTVAALSPVSANEYTGVVRELIRGRFGFIVDDFTNESIFFHFEHAVAGLQPGDRVRYYLSAVNVGKHRGKKICLQVRRVDDVADSKTRPARSPTEGGGSSFLDEEDMLDDFDLLD